MHRTCNREQNNNKINDYGAVQWVHKVNYKSPCVFSVKRLLKSEIDQSDTLVTSHLHDLPQL